MMGEFGPNLEASRINLAEAADFDLGGLCVSPARREVSMNGQRRELEPRVAQVLVALALARPDVVSRDRLIEQCWEGRIVGDDALNRCIVALRHLAKEFSPQPFEIETVSRVGYSLVERPKVAAPEARQLGQGGAIAARPLAFIAVGSARWHRPPQASRVDRGPAFRNLSSGDPYFAEGIGEEMMGQLAREPEFALLDARQYSAAPTTQAVVDCSGRQCRRRQGTGQCSLIRTSDGTRLWSETYDRKLDDILGIQARSGRQLPTGSNAAWFIRLRAPGARSMGRPISFT